MTRRLIASAALFAALFAFAALAPTAGDVSANQKAGKGRDKKQEDRIAGARWVLNVMDGDKVKETHQFLADKGKLTQKGEEIGTYTESEKKDKATITFTGGRLDGTVEVAVTKKDGSKYTGKWKTKGGKESDVVLTLRND
ncbi:MAG: hypothetical protein ABGY75_21430 [Gemmataceae bacterium]